MLNGKSSWTAGLLGVVALPVMAVALAWALWPAGSAQAQEAAGYEPADVQVVPGDRTLTVSWKVTSRPGVSDDQIRHALRWSQQPGVWANPKGDHAVGRNDGVSVEPGVTSYVITGLENGTATGVFVRSFTGPNYYERAKGSSKWVRTKGDHTTPREQQQANNPPTVASAIADATIVNESGTLSVSLTGVFADADNDSLTVTAKSSDTAKATVSVAADQSSLTVAAKSRGKATITVTASDGNGGTVQDEFTVTVKAAPALALPLSHIPELEAGAARDVSLSSIFSDADGDALTVTATSSDEDKATVSVASDQSKLTVTGVAQGAATITVTVQDSDGNQASGAFDVAVVPAPQRQGSAGCDVPSDGDYDADDDGLIEICSLAQLNAIRHDRDNGDGSPVADGSDEYGAAFPGILTNGTGCPTDGCNGYELTADLDFDTNSSGAADDGDAYWNDGKGWLPIDEYGAVFDGGSHVIRNLYIRTDQPKGLFAALGDGAVIRNITLADVDVSGGGDRTGGLVGENNGTISDASVSGTVSGRHDLGGLVA